MSAKKDRRIAVAIECPHCGGAIVINNYRTNQKKFLIGIQNLNNVGPCPHCQGTVRMKVEISKGRVKKSQETSPESEGETNE